MLFVELHFLNPLIINSQTEETTVREAYDFCLVYKKYVQPRQMVSIKTVINGEQL